ncbi:hypothetical protein LCGC14_2027440, partial [marine sediment metagenome]
PHYLGALGLKLGYLGSYSLGAKEIPNLGH